MAAANKVIIVDPVTGDPARVTAGVLQVSGSGGGAVSSVFGRTGAVVAASGDYSSFYVLKSLYDAQTILAAVSDDTPVAVSVPASTFLGRKASGDIAAMSVTEAKAVLAYTNTQVGAFQQLVPTAVKTAATYAAAAGDFVPVDTTSNAVQVTLPAAPADRTIISVKLILKPGTNLATVVTSGSDVFNRAGGGTTATLTYQSQGQIYQYNAALAVWYVLADDLPLSGLDSRFFPAQPNGMLVPSAWIFNGAFFSTPSALGTNNAIGMRCIVPKTGVLHDLAVCIATSNGNIDVGIYDTTVTNRTRLYHSGSVASPGTGWRIIADPALAVNAGDQIDICIACDGATFATYKGATNSAVTLDFPAGFFTGLGGKRLLTWVAATSFPLPSPLAETAMAASAQAFAMMARIT